jgi:hypothetical protein
MTIGAMRLSAALLLLVMISSCAPVRETAVPPQAVAAVLPEPAALAETPAAPTTPAESAESARAMSGDFSGITFEGVTFDSRGHRLVVVDQPGGPGSEFADAAAAGASRRGLAAVNAGFFTPEGAPLGLVVSGGKRSGAWNAASSLGSGVWHEDASGRSAITRREKLGRAAASAIRELLQAGPMLLENGRAVSGLDAEKTSARTLIVWDGGSRWWIGRTPPCTLAALGAALSSARPGGWPVRHALNLDGGRSSDLWISGAVEGGPLVRRPAWNRPVRNFLVLTRR